jgi:2',3'-cyclic-nucleotide 2'-phosphodiesterase (5'-nucleotidase family)
MNIATETPFHRRLLIVTAAVAMIAALMAAAGPADARRGPPPNTPPVTLPNTEAAVWLTLLHNNDGESALLPTEIGGELFGGVANFATVVDQLRAAGLVQSTFKGAKEAAILVSSGDNYLASAQFQASLEKGVPYYDAIAMDMIGYDAIAIGNHEFDFGPDVFQNFVESFTTGTPFLSANLDFSNEPGLQALEDSGRIASSVVIRQRGERFGIIGATTEFLPVISSPRDVIVNDVFTAVQAEVDALEAQGVNKIILISHLQSIVEDQTLAAQLDGVDIMVAGGGDELLANPDDLLVPGDEGSIFGPYPLTVTDVNGTEVPVVTTTGGYRYVGRLVAAFDRQGNVIDIHDSSGPVRVTSGSLPDAVSPDPGIQSAVVEPVQEFVDALATTVVANTEVPLNSRRGVVQTDPPPPPIVVTVPGERVSETNLGNLAADAQLWQASQLAPAFGVAVPDIAFQNGGGIRSPDDLLFPDATPANPLEVTRLDINNQFPFPNFVSIVPDVPLRQVKAILENAVSRVEFVDGRFAQVAGFTYHWDSTGTPNVDRVTRIAIGGTLVFDSSGWLVNPDTTTVNVATIDFLARGGDEYDFGDAEFVTLGVTYEQAVLNYLDEVLGGSITEAQYPNITGTRVIQEG